MKVQASTVIAAPPERLWAMLVDWERQATWVVDVPDVRVIGDLREGTGVRLAAPTRVFGVRLFTDLLEVTVWEPPSRLAVEHRRFVEGGGIWELAPEGDRTRFTWIEEVGLPVPLLGELALAVYRPVLRRMMSRSLQRLRRLAESGRP
jgi:uncharacterized protein YndB with AHSA1/START domain